MCVNLCKPINTLFCSKISKILHSPYPLYLFFKPLKTKTGESLVEAFSRIIKKGCTPGMFHTDKGTEFTNKQFQKLLKEHNIRFFTTHNETKASIVERFSRTLKGKNVEVFDCE